MRQALGGCVCPGASMPAAALWLWQAGCLSRYSNSRLGQGIQVGSRQVAVAGPRSAWPPAGTLRARHQGAGPTSSHCRELILSGHSSARTPSSSTSAAVPGRLPSPAALSSDRYSPAEHRERLGASSWMPALPGGDQMPDASLEDSSLGARCGACNQRASGSPPTVGEAQRRGALVHLQRAERVHVDVRRACLCGPQDAQVGLACMGAGGGKAWEGTGRCSSWIVCASAAARNVPGGTSATGRGDVRSRIQQAPGPKRHVKLHSSAPGAATGRGQLLPVQAALPPPPPPSLYQPQPRACEVGVDAALHAHLRGAPVPRLCSPPAPQQQQQQRSALQHSRLGRTRARSWGRPVHAAVCAAAGKAGQQRRTC
jgi:hypothetical protein